MTVPTNLTEALDLLTPTLGDKISALDVREVVVWANAETPRKVRFATTTNDSLSGLAARDGVTPLAGDRALVKDHATGSSKGIYLASAGGWTRADDFDSSDNVLTNTLVLVAEGTANGGKCFRLSTTGSITVGTTALTFVPFGGSSTVLVDGGSSVTANAVTGIATVTDVGVTTTGPTVTVTAATEHQIDTALFDLNATTCTFDTTGTCAFTHGGNTSVSVTGTYGVTCSGVLTETVNTGSRAVTVGGNTRTEVYNTALRLHAANTAAGQIGDGQLNIYAAADGTHIDHAYAGTVGVGHKIDPAGECDVQVAAGVTAYRTLKNGVRRWSVTTNGIAGGLATASGVQSFAMGDVDTTAGGDYSWASGLDAEATGTYGVSMGAHIVNPGTACVSLGENLTGHVSCANTSQLGFQQTIGANSPYASLLGCYLNVGANCTGAVVLGINASVPDGRPGQLTHSSGCTGFSGTQLIDMVATATAAPAAFVNRQGGAFFPDQASFGLYRIEVLAITDDAVKYAHEIIEIEVVSAIANLTIGAMTIVNSTMAAAGWSVAVTEAAAGELRITLDPGADTVRAGANISWRMVGATYAVP